MTKPNEELKEIRHSFPVILSDGRHFIYISAIQYLPTQFIEQEGAFSPDGRWIAYVSDETGDDEIYVQTFPLSDSKYPISAGGGSEPYWRSDGMGLFYVAADRNLMAAPIKLSPAFEPGLPKRLMPLTAIGQRHSYAIGADGQRFLVLSPAGQKGTASIMVVVNWQTALTK